jgi:hypothetical protein
MFTLKRDCLHVYISFFFLQIKILQISIDTTNTRYQI